MRYTTRFTKIYVLIRSRKLKMYVTYEIYDDWKKWTVTSSTIASFAQRRHWHLITNQIYYRFCLPDIVWQTSSANCVIKQTWPSLILFFVRKTYSTGNKITIVCSLYCIYDLFTERTNHYHVSYKFNEARNTWQSLTRFMIYTAEIAVASRSLLVWVHLGVFKIA